ncbi:hypothetical protein TRVL_02859 [Trypanosoma vivax]|nr:hypothetical protein TRVL_02859 [Trypanosoma vivax]
MEVLRNLKFMQRKEEMKRRELFELNQQKQFEERLSLMPFGSVGANDEAKGAASTYSAALSSSGVQRNTRTILFNKHFPRELYSLSRRTFTGGQNASSATDKGASANAVGSSRLKTDHNKDALSGDDRDEEEDGSEAETDVSDPTAVSYGSKGERFCVRTNAPALPKSLEKKMSGTKRKRETKGEE